MLNLESSVNLNSKTIEHDKRDHFPLGAGKLSLCIIVFSLVVIPGCWSQTLQSQNDEILVQVEEFESHLGRVLTRLSAANESMSAHRKTEKSPGEIPEIVLAIQDEMRLLEDQMRNTAIRVSILKENVKSGRLSKDQLAEVSDQIRAVSQKIFDQESIIESFLEALETNLNMNLTLIST